MKRNKFHIYVYATVAFCIVCLSCNKALEIASPVNKVTTDKIFADSALLNQAVLNMNATMGNYEGNFTPLSGLYTDELATSSSSIFYTDYFNNSLLSDNSSAYNIWQNLYAAIYQSNFLLEGIGSANNISATFKNRVQGEALFIRAYAYFYLVNIYGNLPLIITTSVNTSSAAARSDTATIYMQITSDLEKAKNLLQEVYQGEEKVRPVKWAATALLARAYLYVKKYAEAETNASAVISSNAFSLSIPLTSVFVKNNPESIYQIWNQNGFSSLSGLIPSSGTSAPVYYLTTQLKNSFEAGDKRLTAWVLPLTINGTAYNCFNKYKLTAYNTGTNAEYTSLLRLAEQYLIRAEARILLNKLPEAANDLNSIRNRAGLSPLDPLLNQAGLFTAMQQERKVELYTENGHRFFDLKRWGIINQVMGAAKSHWDAHAQIYPIPLNDRKINPNLTQNPGYN